MEFIKIIILLLLNILIFINADSLNGPNYPTNYVGLVSGQLNLPSQAGANTGIIRSQNVNQLFSGGSTFGTNGAILTGLNGLTGNSLLTGMNNNVGTNGLITGMNGITGLTDVQTSEIIRRQIQTSNFNALNGVGIGGVNPLGTTVIGANGIPVSVTTGLNSLSGMNGVTAVIDPTTGATVGYVGGNGAPVNAGLNGLQAGINPMGVSNGYQVINGNTVVDQITGATVGYLNGNGGVTPVTTTGLNGLQTGFGNMNPLSGNSRYEVLNGVGGVQTVVDRITGAAVGYLGQNGVITPGVNSLQTGYGNPSGVSNGYQVVNGNTVVDQMTGATVGYLNGNGGITPVNVGLNGIQTGTGYPSAFTGQYQIVNGPGGVNIVVDRTTGSSVGYLGPNGEITPGVNSLQTGYGPNNGYQVITELGNPLQTGMNTLYPGQGMNGLNQYNPYQTGYGNSLYPTTSGLNPYNMGVGNVMNPYYGQQMGYNGYPFPGQQQFSGYPMNGNSHSQASASSRTFNL